MRNFDDILRDKLYEATNDYSDKVWSNIKGQIPIKKKSKSHLLWMASFLIVFSMMITMVHQYPNWKIEVENGNKTAALEVNDFILSPKDLIQRHQDQTSISSSIALNSNTHTKEISKTSFTTLADLNVYEASLNKKEESQIIEMGIANENAIPFSFYWQPNIVTNEKEGNATQASLAKLNVLATLHSGIQVPLLNIAKSSKRSKGNDVHCEVLKGKQSKYYISARHISSYAFNGMESKNPAAEEYMNSRHITESKRYSFSDEVTFGLEHRNGFFAELGIRYDQINEKFNYLDPSAYQSSTLITIDTIYNGDNAEILVDTVTTVLEGEREILSNNKFRKLSVPFSVGYQYPLNKKVSLAAKAGLVVNVFSDYKGRMFDEELNIASIGERQSSNDPFFNKLVHSVSGSAFLQYHVNKNMEFLVGVNAYKNLSSTSFETNPIDQKYSSLGIFVGGKYNL